LISEKSQQLKMALNSLRDTFPSLEVSTRVNKWLASWKVILGSMPYSRLKNSCMFKSPPLSESN